MAALNYYVGLARGSGNNIFAVTAGTAPAGTSVDVEINMQINNGTNATGLTSLDVQLLVNTLMDFINSSGLNHAGADLPPL